MAEGKGGLDFTKLKTRKKATTSTTPKRMYKEVEQVEEVRSEAIVKAVPQPKARKAVAKTVEKPQPAKVGRKSWKTEGVNYTRMAFDTPLPTKQKLKELLAVKFFGKYISQDEMINVALNEFIKKHSK